MTYKIPFNRFCFTGNEQRYMSEAVQNGHISGDGPFTRKCHALLKEQLGVRMVLLDYLLHSRFGDVRAPLRFAAGR